MSNVLENLVWAEKYRPKTVDDCVLPEKVKSQVKEMIASGQIPGLLLSGSAGTGKTTLLRAIINELDGEMLFINASLESGIDVIRTKVMQFSSTVSLESKAKFVVFDEFDGMSRNSQDALRGMIEEFGNVRFCFTCNFKNKIIDAIQSRTTSIDFKIKNEDKSKVASAFFKRVIIILKTENVQYEVPIVAEIVNKYYPDFRRTLNELQRAASSGIIDKTVLNAQSSTSFPEVFKYLKEKNFSEMRKWVGKNSDVEPQQLFRSIFDGASEMLDPKSIPQVILILADYSFKCSHSVDQEIMITAALTELMANATWK